MAGSTTSIETQTHYEDVLAHLPASKTTAYDKGQMIYDLDRHPRSIYLVVNGAVGISHRAENGADVLLDIVRTDELFGESAFLEVQCPSERASAIEKAELMNWTVSEMEDLVTKRPRLAVALLQILAKRNAEYTRRIQSFAVDSVERRLARSLIRFSERFGVQEQGGSVWMMPLTHEMLSRYIGTSREIVTHNMNRVRKQGCVTYSRQGIRLHLDLLRKVLYESGFVSAAGND